MDNIMTPDGTPGQDTPGHTPKSSGSKKKPKSFIKKFRICVIGPSYVGKTQIVNRMVNNAFTGYYEPTIKQQGSRRAYNLHDDQPDRQPYFFDLDIIDLFPHDHPFLDEDMALMGDAAREMTNKLDEIVQSPYDQNTDILDRIHAYVFVYDSSNKRTFTSMMCMLESIEDREKSKRKQGGKYFFPKKIIVGNKKDLRKNKEAGIIGQADIKQLAGITIKEVSALTNHGIQEVLKSLVMTLDKDTSIDEEQYNNFKKKNREAICQGKTAKQIAAMDAEESFRETKIGIKIDDAKEASGFFSACSGPRVSNRDIIIETNKSESDCDEEGANSEDEKVFLQEVLSQEDELARQQFYDNHIEDVTVKLKKKEKEGECVIF